MLVPNLVLSEWLQETLISASFGWPNVMKIPRSVCWLSRTKSAIARFMSLKTVEIPMTSLSRIWYSARGWRSVKRCHLNLHFAALQGWGWNPVKRCYLDFDFSALPGRGWRSVKRCHLNLHFAALQRWGWNPVKRCYLDFDFSALPGRGWRSVKRCYLDF